MTESISPEVSDRICQHMNDDHAGAVLLYAQIFGKVAEAKASRLIKIDPEGMDLAVETDQAPTTLRIDFDHVLQDAEDAHQTLIAMVKVARAQSQEK
ncbi:MAG: DUF2470 domain-containing protein [Acaryochloridaceae cyanobacterium SU_2_1]|nr:DUF2470 domain-containing protein [Acaryochloridaceae cyanobacterium SU_2_1]NJM95047.1 DUF2470 domain-containing protein [Acaryochloridaceae cyanobacterium CSU_5_19]